MTAVGSSWGRWPRHTHRVWPLADRHAALPAGAAPMLAWGHGRSYGDSCQNDGGTLLRTRGLDRYIAFDPATGVLEVEAGVLFDEIIAFALPQGWFLPVTPGTRYLTVGGAIANDVHGKNHHRAGSFGDHVLGFELLRSDGSRRWCTPEANADWFAATIGGLGLTGLITRARITLKRVAGPWLIGDSRRFRSLAEFFALADAAEADWEYTVAWIDSSATGRQRGRGQFIRGNHVPAAAAGGRREPAAGTRRVPFVPPLSLINGLSLRAFNTLYFHRPAAQAGLSLWHWKPFFYPLDALLDWNRIYGPAGFYQYQCVLPRDAAEASLDAMLARIAASGLGSFLVVLKTFGERPARGWLSFPRPGATLAIDFPNRGAPTLALLDALDALTLAAGGAVYPAKDARMSAETFQRGFPAWSRLAEYRDPQFSSSFWRRVTSS